MRFYCEEQLSGIETIDFYLLSETSNWPVHLSDRSSAQILFNPEVHNIEATIKENSFKNGTKQKGDIYEVELTYSMLTRSEALEQLLDQYANTEGIAVVKYYNNFTKVFGSDVEPLLLSFDINDGTSPESESGINILIQGIQRNRPVYLTK
ncbi:hypothetical protein HX056_00920 [Myroides odoratimimus]|uniref:hypothetical protein n=1 Tax=Myroides odoratimimus TaxID=76832 RepID=UPI0025791B77|nr:hypothetical protein [Myroides odoratimimus]MDM1441900.1 hypothetical protein [Myroides odoratimimus]